MTKKKWIILGVVLFLLILIDSAGDSDLGEKFQEGKDAAQEQLDSGSSNEEANLFDEEDLRDYITTTIVDYALYEGNSLNTLKQDGEVITIDITFNEEYKKNNGELAKFDIESFMERVFDEGFTDVSEVNLTSNVFSIDVTIEGYQNFKDNYDPNSLDIDEALESMRK